MKITPILTEKSLKDSKDGKYSFWVPLEFDKFQIKSFIGKAFGVHVIKIRSINFRKLSRKNIKGDRVTQKARKKVIVSLLEKEKIDLFETKKGKS